MFIHVPFNLQIKLMFLQLINETVNGFVFSDIQTFLNVNSDDYHVINFFIPYCPQTRIRLEHPDGYFLLQRIAKDTRSCCREEGSEVRRDRKQEVEFLTKTVLTLGLNQITKFIYRLDGPLGEGNVYRSNSEYV
jgi:hypothetical protein